MSGLSTYRFIVPVLIVLLPRCALAEEETCVGTQGECRGSTLLQHGFAAGRKEASIAVEEHDHASSHASARTIPRHDLTNLRVPLHTDQETLAFSTPRQHNRCTASSPDGRLFLCGLNAKYVKYLKFESMSFTLDGVPIWNDDVWAGGNHTRLHEELRDYNHFTWCWPNQSAPFEAITEDGTPMHVYTTLISNRNNMQYLTVKVANPNTGIAEIVNMTLGDLEVPLEPRFPKTFAFSGDGKLVVGQDGAIVQYMALPEDAEPCSFCALSWHDARMLHEMHDDPDNLNLPNRYGLAKYPIKDGISHQFNDTYSLTGEFLWLDLEARNLIMGDDGGIRVIGADTYGEEVMPDGAMNQDTGKNLQFWSSPYYNFDALRTKPLRFPGELHTSGVGSAAAYQLPMTPRPGTFPMLAGRMEYYTEVNLRYIREAKYDMLNMPMIALWNPAPVARSWMPGSGYWLEMSPNHFVLTRSSGSLLWNGSTDVPSAPQGRGPVLKQNKGTIKVEIGQGLYPVKGMDTATSSFTTLITMKAYGTFNNCNRHLIFHDNLKLRFKSSRVLWVVGSLSVDAGPYTENEWTHLAMVFDGVTMTYKFYINGVMVKQESSTDTTFQLTTTASLVIGHKTYGTTGTCSWQGEADNLRMVARALSNYEICEAAQGVDCYDSIDYTTTPTQLQITTQMPDCTEASLNTFACAAAMHKVCYNYVAEKQSDAAVPSRSLAEFGSPTVPVSMGGVVVAKTATQVSVACTPYTNHLSVPVEFFHMSKFHPQCSPVTDYATESLFCNIAAQVFCKDALESASNPSLVTGVVYEVEARAWVTCFEADSVIVAQKSSMVSCTDPGSVDCMVAASQECTTAAGSSTAGVIQAMDNTTLSIHCFGAPSAIGIVDFDF